MKRVTVERWLECPVCFCDFTTIDRRPEWEQVCPACGERFTAVDSGIQNSEGGSVTREQRRELEALVKRLRERATPVGPLHSFWDVIQDIECFLIGAPTLINYSAEEWIEHATAYLERGR